MEKLTINLGNGVSLSAPIKLNMTYDEWVRMSNYINSLMDNRFLIQEQKRGNLR
jgi:hypothetical protein